MDPVINWEKTRTVAAFFTFFIISQLSWKMFQDPTDAASNRIAIVSVKTSTKRVTYVTQDKFETQESNFNTIVSKLSRKGTTCVIQ
jgi:hypothetical protein